METLKEKRARAGRAKKGHKSKKTIELSEALKQLKERGAKLAQGLLSSQAILAHGTHTLMRIDEVEEYYDKSDGKRAKRVTKKMVVVTDPEELERVFTSFGEIDGAGVVDDSYYFVTHKEPSNQAIDSIQNRTFGRPTESVEVSGRDGQPLIIRLNR